MKRILRQLMVAYVQLVILLPPCWFIVWAFEMARAPLVPWWQEALLIAGSLGALALAWGSTFLVNRALDDVLRHE